jgi:hypothetical protein
MELQEYIRKPFPVKAVQLDIQNAAEVAEWCGGTLGTKRARILGAGNIDLPTITIQGTGDNAGKDFVAEIGHYIVELKGNFRVFKEPQFRNVFKRVEKPVQHDPEEVAQADQEREDALHAAGQL